MATRVDLVCCRTTADFSRRATHDMYVNELVPPRWQAASAEDTSAVQTTFALWFISVPSEILAFRHELRPNADQLNC